MEIEETGPSVDPEDVSHVLWVHLYVSYGVTQGLEDKMVYV